MDKMVYQPFKDGTVGIVGQIQTIVRHLYPSAHGVVLDEVHAVFQEQYEVIPMLYGTDGIIFIKSGPTGAEDTRLEYGAIIHEQQSSIGQFTVRSNQTE